MLIQSKAGITPCNHWSDSTVQVKWMLRRATNAWAWVPPTFLPPPSNSLALLSHTTWKAVDWADLFSYITAKKFYWGALMVSQLLHKYNSEKKYLVHIKYLALPISCFVWVLVVLLWLFLLWGGVYYKISLYSLHYSNPPQHTSQKVVGERDCS